MVPSISDDDIIRAVRTRADGVEWLARYVNEYWKSKSYKVLRSEGASDVEAGDVFKQAISALYYNLAQNAFKGDSALETYFNGICKNKLAKKIRENIRDREKGDQETADYNHPHQEMERKQLPEILEKCLSEMGDPCSTVERLKLDGWGLDPIAGRLGMTPRHVTEISARCRENLKARLKKYGYGR